MTPPSVATFVTEEEARQRWCPFGRVAVGSKGIGSMNFMPQVPSFNRIAVSETEQALVSTCVGSRCMAWRVAEQSPALPPGLVAASGCCGLSNPFSGG